MKKISTYLLLFLFGLTTSFSLIIPAEVQEKQDVALSYEWLTEGNLQPEEAVFIASFLEAYKEFSEEQLGLQTSKLKFLQNAFQEERDDLKKQDGGIFLISAKEGSHVVGFASFNKTEKEGEVYIRQLAVDPAYWYRGIGKKLVFSIGDKVEGIKRYVLVTRRINGIAKAFYQKLGFRESAYVHEGLDSKKYVGYELQLNA